MTLCNLVSLGVDLNMNRRAEGHSLEVCSDPSPFFAHLLRGIDADDYGRGRALFAAATARDNQGTHQRISAIIRWGVSRKPIFQTFNLTFQGFKDKVKVKM